MIRPLAQAEYHLRNSAERCTRPQARPSAGCRG